MSLMSLSANSPANLSNLVTLCDHVSHSLSSISIARAASLDITLPVRLSVSALIWPVALSNSARRAAFSTIIASSVSTAHTGSAGCAFAAASAYM